MPNIFDEEPKQENKYDLFKNDKPFVKKKISRLEKDKIIFGICSGLAYHYNLNPSLVRLLFALSIVLGGLGAVVYLILFFFIPFLESGDDDEIGEEVQLYNLKILLGIALVTIGFYFIIVPGQYFPFLFLIYIPMKIFFPIVFLIAGFWIQKNYRLKNHKTTKSNFQRPIKKRLFMGVCIGLAEYLGTYAIIFRLLFIVLTFTTLGLGILIYFLIALLSKPKRVVIIE